MRAVVIREPGGPEVLELRELPDPEVPFGCVRIAASYAGVNRADLLQRAGFYPAPPGVPVDIPGLEYAGTVDSVGPGTTRFKEGERVFGLVAGGAYADKIIAHERECVRIPDALSDEEAAAVPEAFVTAYDAMVVRGRMRSGERVLVSAVGSGVGTAAIQLGRTLGAFVVGTSRTDDKLGRCRELGLDVGIAVRDGVFAEAVRTATDGAGADVIVELVGGGYLAEDVRAAAPRARIVVVGLTGGIAGEIDLRVLLHKRLEIIGTVLRARPLEEKIEAAQLLERNIAPLFARRAPPPAALRPVIDRVFPIGEAAAAHEHVASNASFGKVLLRMGS